MHLRVTSAQPAALWQPCQVERGAEALVLLDLLLAGIVPHLYAPLDKRVCQMNKCKCEILIV